MNEAVLLDTSAIFTYIDDEPGADRVARYLRLAQQDKTRLIASCISLVELRYIVTQERNEDEADYLVALVKAWPVEWVYPDEKQCLLAGRFKAGRRLSLADALIAAAASVSDAKLVHKDPELDPLSRKLPLESLPYKASG